MPSRGVALIAYGETAEREADECLETLRRFHDWPVVVQRSYLPGLPSEATNVQKSRWAKVTLPLWVPWDEFLYLDADTRVRGDLSAGFEVLADGWELAITPSENQKGDWLWHTTPEERLRTRIAWSWMEPLQLQCGVMFVKKTKPTQVLFHNWSNEWQLGRGQDQGAFLRALKVSPVRVWLFGRVWNGGALINHLFGRTRNGK